MTNRYAGRCSGCGAQVAAGEGEAYKAGSRWSVRHVGECPAQPQPAPEAPGTVHLSTRERPYSVGEVILSSGSSRKRGGPDGLVVLTASRRYWSQEDSDDMGDCGPAGYVYSATARPATREEMAPRIEEQHGAALQIEAERQERASVAVWRQVGEAAIAEATAGLARTSVRAEGVCLGDMLVRGIGAGHYHPAAYALVDASGQTVGVMLDWSTYDFDQVSYWYPAELARTTALAAAARMGVTVEIAREWLSKYSECHGAEIYRAVVESVGVTS